MLSHEADFLLAVQRIAAALEDQARTMQETAARNKAAIGTCLKMIADQFPGRGIEVPPELQ